MKLLTRLEPAKKIIFYFEENPEQFGPFEEAFMLGGVCVEKRQALKKTLDNLHLWLIRHGYCNPITGRLTPEGVARVEKAATVFQDKPLTLYVSPVTRCLETAALLKNRVRGAEAYPCPWLDESADLPENWRSLLLGDTIAMVSPHLVLCRLAQQFIPHFDFFNFTCGWPVEVAATSQGLALRPFPGPL